MKSSAINLITVFVGAVLVILWQNELGVKIEGTTIARINYMLGLTLYIIIIWEVIRKGKKK